MKATQRPVQEFMQACFPFRRLAPKRLDEHARILNRQLKHVVAKSERQRRAPEMLVACTEDVHSGLVRCIDVNPLANGTMGDLERQSSVCVASRRRQAACNWRSGDWVELLPLGRSSRAVRPVQRFALSRMPAIFDQEVSMTLRGPPHAAVSVLVSLMSWPTFAGQAQETQERPAQERDRSWLSRTRTVRRACR